MPKLNEGGIHRCQVALEKRLPIPSILGSDQSQPDPVVREQARVHPVSTRKLDAIEDIVSKSQSRNNLCI